MLLRELYRESRREVSHLHSVMKKKSHLETMYDVGCISPLLCQTNHRVKLANEVTFKRMKETMETLRDTPPAELSTLSRIMLGQSKPSELKDLGEIKFFDETLNSSQKQAVQFALSAPELALIHGPPGTGKTYTLIEIIRQLVSSTPPPSLLVVGPSNISVDNLCERLAPLGIPLVRIGHPARLLPSIISHSLDNLTRTSDQGILLRDARDDIDKAFARISKTRSGRERKEIYSEIKELRKEVRVREIKCIDSIIQTSKVHLSTLHGSRGRELSSKRVWDIVIVDEASQALEAQTWIPLLYANKVILAGDHLQLPPTVKSVEKGKSSPLEITLFDRMIKLYGDTNVKMLTTQYRMNNEINAFPSKTLYQGKLVAAPSVAERRLKDVEGVEETENTEQAVVFVDTQGGDFPESTPEGDEGSLLGESKRNEGEAKIVRAMVKDLVEAGVKPNTIAVITPYNAQVTPFCNVH
jgi:DNA polymerase alpha-associated DNA helicase A